MAKSELKIKARNMRRSGESIKYIAQSLNISKSTSSIWCSDISLTRNQLEKLHEDMLKGSYKGRLLGAHTQRQKRLNKISLYEHLGKERIKTPSHRDILMTFIGLYLGEGNKKGHAFQFANSNYKIIRIVLFSLYTIFNISPKRIYCNIILNSLYESSQKTIKNNWSKLTKIPLNQVKKTIIIHTENKKIYEYSKEYLGTLIVRAKRSSELQYEILGLAKALLESDANATVAFEECI